MDIRLSRYDDSTINIHVSSCFMIPDTDKAYIAGLFDGEGSINFTRKPEKKPNPVGAIKMLGKKNDDK